MISRGDLTTTFDGIDGKMSSNNGNDGFGRSTRGASKLRRDQINRELAALRQLLPLDDSIRERLFQLQVMALSCISIRKAKFFGGQFNNGKIKQQSKAAGSPKENCSPPIILEALLNQTFLLAVTEEGKLLGMSENFASGSLHQISTEEWMAQSDSLFDLIDPRDEPALSELLENEKGEKGLALVCRWRAPKLGGVTKRQTDWDGKPTLMEGQFCFNKHQNRRIFLAICRPLINASVDDENLGENSAESPFAADPSCFRLSLSLDFHIQSICSNTKSQLGFLFPSSFASSPSANSSTHSLYHFVHPSYGPTLAQLHAKILDEKMASSLLLPLIGPSPDCCIWHFHAIFQRHPKSNNNQIKAIFQLLSPNEAIALANTDWLYADEREAKREEKEKEGDGNRQQESSAKRPPMASSSKKGIVIGSSGGGKKQQKQRERDGLLEPVIASKMEPNPFKRGNSVMIGGDGPGRNASSSSLEASSSSSFPPHPPEWVVVVDFDQKQQHLLIDKPDLNNNHLADQNAAAIWPPEEGANLLEDLPTFMLPELDDRDLDEFFRQVEQREEEEENKREEIEGAEINKRRRIEP